MISLMWNGMPTASTVSHTPMKWIFGCLLLQYFALKSACRIAYRLAQKEPHESGPVTTPICLICSLDGSFECARCDLRFSVDDPAPEDKSRERPDGERAATEAK
jgi:hypothetical protein